MTDSKLYKGLLIAGVTAAGAMLAAGCNSSSGSSDSSSPTFSSLTQEQQEASVAAMAMEIDDMVLGMGAMGDMALGMAGVDSEFEDPREPDVGIAGIAGVQGDGDQASLAGWDDLCDSGSYTLHADEADHFHVEFNNCSSSVEDPESGYSWSHNLNGELETELQDSVTHDHFVTSRAEGYAVEVEMSGDGDSFAMALKMDGQSSQHYTDWNDYILEANQSMEMSMSCDGESFGGTFSFDDLEVTTKPSSLNASDAEMEASGSFSFDGGAQGGSWSMETVEAVHFPQDGHAYSGKMNIVVDGQSFEVEYEASGVWVNGTFYSWDELEAIDEDIDDDMDFDFECMF